MTVEDFWNNAFISALSRLPAAEAKAEADKALEMTVEHWRQVAEKHGAAVPIWKPFGHQLVSEIPRKRGEA